MLNLSEKDIYNPNLVWFNKITFYFLKGIYFLTKFSVYADTCFRLLNGVVYSCSEIGQGQ